MKRLGLAVFGAGALTSVLLGQLKVDVGLVNVVATVTDEKGRYVSDLTSDDFVVQEDGQAQTIAHFSQSNDIPVSIGVDLDTSGSMERKIRTATAAVERFIRTIHQDDDIFLMTFSERPVLRQDFTDDREKLAAVLRRISVGGGTALYEALTDSLRKIKRGKHEKKAILLITDGEDTTSEISFNDAATAVRESELLVYCLGIAPSSSGSLTERSPSSSPPVIGGRTPFPFPGGPFPFPGGPGGTGRRRPGPRAGGGGAAGLDTVDMDVLNAFADSSGGKAWLISGTWTEGRGNQIEGILDEIASELRNQYSIGYYPSHPFQDGKWHRIEIRGKNPRYNVRARKEYFGK
jgi:VWFA-related protein